MSNDQSNKSDDQSVVPVGTIVGESTTREFRMAVRPYATLEQDIVEVRATLADASKERAEVDHNAQPVRVWAKVQRIERLNPLFPREAAQEIADAGIVASNTVLSLSREMVTAVCQVIGYQPEGSEDAKLKSLRYPARPTAEVCLPQPEDLNRILLGGLDTKDARALHLATLSNRDIPVHVDGHYLVSRHLAVLGMTGAGKSRATRRIIEELAARDYPVVVFDPHGDYSRLHEAEGLGGKVEHFHPEFPIFDMEADKVAQVVGNLTKKMEPPTEECFKTALSAAKKFVEEVGGDNERASMFDKASGKTIDRWRMRPGLWLVAAMLELAHTRKSEGENHSGELDPVLQSCMKDVLGRKMNPLEAALWRSRVSAKRVRQTAERSAGMSKKGIPAMPTDRTTLVEVGKVRVISLSGYPREVQATIFDLVARDIFDAMEKGKLSAPRALFVLEEGHHFAPNSPGTGSESLATVHRIAQEGRKFGLGMILVSQRPSRLDATALSQCNSQIIMRLVNPADQKFVGDTVESLSSDELRMLSSLEDGEAVFAGQMVKFPIRVQVRSPDSEGEREEEDAFAEIRAEKNNK